MPILLKLAHPSNFAGLLKLPLQRRHNTKIQTGHPDGHVGMIKLPHRPCKDDPYCEQEPENRTIKVTSLYRSSEVIFKSFSKFPAG